MIPAADARATLAHLPVAAVARLAWRSADGDTDAAVILDARTGAIEVLTWRAGSYPDVADALVVLAYAPASRYASITRALARGVEIPPSGELVEEHVARASVEAFAAGFGAALAVQERLADVLAGGRRDGRTEGEDDGRGPA